MRLKEIRKARKLSVPALAELSGVPRRTIQELEVRNDGRVSTMIKLADALDVSVDYLLGLHNVPDDKMLVSLYSVASSDDKRVLWTLLERYGGNHGTTKRQ